MKQLYQELLKTHYTSPIGLNLPIEPTHIAEGYNATCGDEITIKVKVCDSGNFIKEIAFESDSCAICNASASILCQEVLSKDTNSVKQYFHYLMSEFEKAKFSAIDIPIPEQLDSLVSVNAYPTRINCALLPWQTAIDAINSEQLTNSLGELDA